MASAEREPSDPAAAVVQRMTAALAAGDGAAACALLLPDTRAEVEKSAGAACDQAIADEELPTSGTVRTVDVYGQWARVVTADDTVFLAVARDGWRIVAAGCVPRGDDRPYDCTLRGS